MTEKLLGSVKRARDFAEFGRSEHPQMMVEGLLESCCWRGMRGRGCGGRVLGVARSWKRGLGG